MKFFIYSRKSVYTGKGESIENQIEMCRQYIKSKYGSADDREIMVYEDEGFSAKNTHRPQFQQMLQDIKVLKPDCLICYRLDRISRSVSDFSSLIEDLNSRNIAFICIKEEFDTSKPMGKAMMYIASVFAQLERETIAERVRDNMMMLAQTGRWLGGSTPAGYTSEKHREIIIDGRVKTACKLKENPLELEVVDTIFRKYLELESLSGVSKYLIKEGIKSRSGQFYSLLGIKEILANPVYSKADKAAFQYFTARKAHVCFEESDCTDQCGLLAYNKRDYKKKHAPRQSIDNWIVAIGRHKGLVPGEQWAAVQALMENNLPTGKAPAKMHNDYSLLSGLIYCQKCGARMFAKGRSGRGDTFDYICNSKLRGGTALCPCGNLGGKKTDEIILEELRDYTQMDSGVFRLIENLRREISAEPDPSPLEALNARLEKCNTEMDNLVKALSVENLNGSFAERLNSRAGELERELSSLNHERTLILSEENAIAEKELQAELLTAALSGLNNSYEALSIQEKRALIKLAVEKILWDGENLHVFICGQ